MEWSESQLSSEISTQDQASWSSYNEWEGTTDSSNCHVHKCVLLTQKLNPIHDLASTSYLLWRIHLCCTAVVHSTPT